MVDRNKKMQIAGWFNVDEVIKIRAFAKLTNRSLSYIITNATMKFIEDNTEDDDESIPEDTNNG